MKPSIVVHGGAGNWDLHSDRLNEAVADCEVAAAAGQAILVARGPALDAVETAVRILEDSPVLDAGRGSYLNLNGQIEMDALIMDGATLDLGAVAAAQSILHPISLARKVMSDCEHSFLVGSGADAFADSIFFPRCDISDLLVGEELEAFSTMQEASAATLNNSTDSNPTADTVGAVAIDMFGNLAAATSTGGTRRKRAGRVGDSPLVGSGAYADNWSAAASATGQGEALMKVLISKRVCDFVAGGLSAQKACEAAIGVLEERVKGLGGLIAIDVRGRIGVTYNTIAMPYAYAVASQQVVSNH